MRKARFTDEQIIGIMNGSETLYIASEKKSAEKWLNLCFPRFYLYDVLRGLNALLIWSEKSGQAVPPESIQDVVTHLSKRFPDGAIRIERHSYEGVGTILPSAAGEWIRRQPATFFPLLEKVSRIADVSPFLSKQWTQALDRISAASKSKSLL